MNTTIDTPTTRFLQQFIPMMAADGFSYRKSGHRFQKTFAHGTYEYSLNFDGRGGTVRVGGALFVHFDALEKQLTKAIGRQCNWAAGASLLNAGAKNWTYSFAESEHINMTPKQRSGIPTDVIHPQARIEAGVQMMFDGYRQYAVPLFQSLQTYRHLLDFYLSCLRQEQYKLCPFPESTIYLSVFLTILLDGDMDELMLISKNAIRHSSQDTKDKIKENLVTLQHYAQSHDLKKLLA